MSLFHVTPRRMDDDQVARVRDPATGQVLPIEGATVAWSTYWERRLQDGEIDPPIAVEDEPQTPAKDARPRRTASTAVSADNKD